MSKREKEIIDDIEKITGIRPQSKDVLYPKNEGKYRTFEIKNVLLISSSYDFFLLEEEGRLENLFRDIYDKVQVPSIPKIIHLETGKEAFDDLDEIEPDLAVIFNQPPDFDVLELTNNFKEEYPNLPVVFLSDNTPIINEIKDNDEKGVLDKIFTWSGDGSILITIVHHIEDMKNIENDTLKEGRGILLIEDSIEYYSSYLKIIYELIWDHITSLMNEEDLNQKERFLKYKRRPFTVHTEKIDQGRKLYQRYQGRWFAVITDNKSKINGEVDINAGIKFAKNIKKSDPNMPVLVQSSRVTSDKLDDFDIEIVQKDSPSLIKSIEDFVKECIGPRELVFEKGGKEILRVKNIEELISEIWNLDEKIVRNLAKQESLIKWLYSIEAFELGKKFEEIIENESNGKVLKESFIHSLEEYIYSKERDKIEEYKRKGEQPYSRFSRIGKGALGGKARGLAFIAKLISKYISEDMFDGLRITVPRTIVLSTDVFEKFLKDNDLIDPYLFNLPDKRIAAKFMDAELPATVIGDIRSFVRNTRRPLIVRSSGVLEDSLLEPFAGIYASMYLPNESWETDLRFQEVCNAIKYVYASTFFEKARTYLKSTPKKLGDEKMAVILQEVVGKKHEKYFYPDVSGVAKSYNHYPPKRCEPEDGIVYLTLGLGKAVVEGNRSYCFCPEHPKYSMYGTPEDFIKHSQSKFYALNLESVYRIVNKDEETSLVKLDIENSRKHGVLEKVASTYSIANDKLYPGIDYEGPKVVDFGPIVRYNTIPLVHALRTLLNISEKSLGYPVEVEFTLNFGDDDSEPAELVILQLRSMIARELSVEVNIKDHDKDELICHSDNVLGNGIIRNIRDIVYVNPKDFNMGKSPEVAEHIRKINKKLMDEERPYILIGPGRWGSNDHWLGIPVQWTDIAGAKIIVEASNKGRRIEPSQGSHFFHDMVSSKAAYFMAENGDIYIDWNWLESLDIVEEKGKVKHVRSREPIEARMDGKNSEGIIMKRINKVDDQICKGNQPIEN
ncbi:MAG: PEP/pyruvate-binding domain-containing protein [Thermoplasmatota archaeon]